MLLEVNACEDYNNDRIIRTVTSKVTFSSAEPAFVLENGGGDARRAVDIELDLIEEGVEDGATTANGDVPLKGETPPMGRRNLFRRMTKVSRHLKDDGKEWIDKHLRRRGSGSSSNDESGDETHKGEDGEKQAEEP